MDWNVGSALFAIDPGGQLAAISPKALPAPQRYKKTPLLNTNETYSSSSRSGSETLRSETLRGVRA
jgi:hypothetical protein